MERPAMPSIHYALFRATFRTAIGEERFRKFVAAGVRPPHLRFWQEVELRDFFEARPELRLNEKELEEALRICQLHDLTLQAGSAEVFRGHLDYGPDYMRARREEFPHASADCLSSGGSEDAPAVVEVFFCPECRNVRAAWLQRQEFAQSKGSI
jgi:hypothetical protein